MTEHHQRRLLSNKSSISNSHTNTNSDNSTDNGATVSNRYLNNSNSNRWLLQQQQQQYPNIAATSTLNTQIYNNRAHSLQQLQIRDPYGGIVGYSQQQLPQQQQQQIPIQGQGQGQPVYMDPYSYMYSTPAVVIPLTHQRQLNPMINHHHQQQQTNQLQQRVPQQYLRGPNNNNHNNNHNSNGRRRNNNNNNSNSVNGRRKSTTQGQTVIMSGNNSTTNKHLRNVKDVNDSEQANEITLKSINLQNYYDIVFGSIDDNRLNDYKELLENISNDNTAKVKTIINKIPKKPQQQQQQSANKIIYKLKVPILTVSEEKSSNNNNLFIDTIADTYKNRNSLRQPLNLGGSTSFKVSSINDFSPKLLETFLNSKGKHPVTSDTTKSTSNGTSVLSGATSNTSNATSITATTTPGSTSTRPRQLQLKANVSALYNESFDLSFDGKAMDRSDIFRMVDSFSVAFSDNDDSNIMMQNTQSIIIQDGKDKKHRKINNHKKLNQSQITRINKDEIDIDEDTENNIESTKNESQINESNNDLADAGSSNIIDNNESSFIVNPSDKILPAEISNINTAY